MNELTEAFKKINDGLKNLNVNEELTKISNAIKQLHDEEKKIELGTIPRGGLFDTNLGRFQVLDHDRTYGFTKVIQYDFYKEDVSFDNNSCDYLESELRKMFETEITERYEEVFGDALVEHTVEIVSVDMQKYGELTAKVRPITFDEAREFNELLVKADIGDWWWTCTPWSIAGRGYKYSIAVVSPSGDFNWFNCRFSNGVRPFCILKSNIFVSEVEDLG